MKARVKKVAVSILLIPLVAVLCILLLLFAPFYFAYCFLLRALIEISWGRRGRRILLVYSRSPHWQEYIERNWLPTLGQNAVVLNWSDRSDWKRRNTLAALAFRHWSSDTDFNPMAILFPPFGKARRLGFYYAFRDYRHGKEQALRSAESELLQFAQRLRSASA